jgi:arsenite-transporting ATPase
MAKRQFVVIDTAPTGHTLLLLDTTGSYHKEVLRNTNMSADRIRTPLMYLQYPEFAKIVIVTLPETTPMREATSLQDDLGRSGIQPYAWVVNQCLSAVPDLRDPLLRQRAANEGPVISQIEKSLSKRVYGIPFLTSENVLAELVGEAVVPASVNS